MPKIKLSALVSDIKGKSNGSVFSKNAGGVYFRNNPSGGGRDSVRWQKRKGQFASLSTQWKSLNEDQVQAWKDAVISYPTLNAFGETRYPSGYELFMKLNGVLTAQNFPLQLVPAVKRSIPDTGLISINYPPRFQLNPNYMLNMFSLNPERVSAFMSTNDYMPAYTLFDDQTFSARFIFSPIQHQNFLFNEQYLVFSALGDDNYGWTFHVSVANQTTATGIFSCETVTGKSQFSFSIENFSFGKPFHFLFSTSSDIVTQLIVYVNGVKINPVLMSSGAITSASNELKIKVGDLDAVTPLLFSVSDFRYYKETFSSQAYREIYQGYVFDVEYLLFDCITHQSDQFTNFGSLGSDYNFAYENENGADSALIPCNFALIPLFSAELENVGIDNLYLAVYATAPRSYGVTAKQTALKQISLVLWDDLVTEFNLSDAYKTAYGNVPANSNVNFYFQIVDSTNGDAQAVKKKGKGNTVRFKAGADLTEKVN